jgi:type IV secretory pathway TraG/TraD family ATPase VirD4
MTDDLNRRMYFFLDELGKLPNMSVIEDMMTAARSKGGSLFIGI